MDGLEDFEKEIRARGLRDEYAHALVASVSKRTTVYPDCIEGASTHEILKLVRMTTEEQRKVAESVLNQDR